MSTDMKYIHPHSESRIIDNAVLTVSASGLSNKFIALEAEKGMPNEATYISSPSEYTFNFGEPNYSKYGQSGLNAIQWLRAGGGLWVIRVVPDDETFAGLSIGIGYRAESEYANDEPEFKRLERTEKQIEHWNNYYGENKPADGNTVMVKGKSSGNSVLLPKFYASTDGKNPEVSLGLLTKDEIALLSLKSGTSYQAIAVRHPAVIANGSQPLGYGVKLKFEAKVTYNATRINSSRETPAEGDTGFFYILNQSRASEPEDLWYNETSAAAHECEEGLYIRLDDETTEKSIFVTSYFGKLVKTQEEIPSEIEGGEPTIRETSEYVQFDGIEDLIDSYCKDGIRNECRKHDLVATETNPAQEAFKETTYLSRLGKTLSDPNGIHTADFINEIKSEIADYAAVCGLSGLSHPSSSSEWKKSYEVYRFEPISKEKKKLGSVRPVSEKEMGSIGTTFKVSQPALTAVEYEDWIFLNNLDSDVFVLGSQFGSEDNLPMLAADEDNTGLSTSDGDGIAADVATDEGVGGLTATNPEVVVSTPSTGYYEMFKLYYVSDATTGKDLYSKTLTTPESAVYNMNNAPSRFADILEKEASATFYIIEGSSDKTAKPVVEYTAVSKVANNADDVKFEGFDRGESTTEEDVASALLKFLEAVTTSDTKFGGHGFMKFELDDEGNTVVTFPTTTVAGHNTLAGYLTAEEYKWLNDKALQRLFVAENDPTLGDPNAGSPNKYILKESFTSAVIPSELKPGQKYGALANEDGTGLFLVGHDGDTASYTFNPAVDEWRIVLKTNKYLTEMLKSEESTMEGVINHDDVYGDIHFAPFYKAAILDGDGLYGIRAKYAATAFDSAFFTGKMQQEDPDHQVTITGKSTGEYAFYDERVVQPYYAGSGEKEINEPNPEYAHAVYNAIGFVATPYSIFELQGSKYQEDDPEVIEQRAEAGKGRVVGSTLDKITTIAAADMRIPATSYVEFLRFLPKGSGKWYNRLSINLSYDDSMDKTYTEWSMFRLTISEKVDGGEISREAFNVSLDPDAISAAKESLFIEDVVNRFSKYLTCVVNYDNLANFIDAKIGPRTVDNKPVEDEDGNEITVPVDAVVKYINNQIDLDEFNERIFGDDYVGTDLEQYKITNLMSAIGYDDNLCHLDTTIYNDEGVQEYLEPFVSLYLFQTVTSTNSLYLNGGTHGHGWGYEHENDEGELITNSTLEQALVKAYNGTTDAIITNINLCVFDMVMDCNYPVVVKTAMNELSSVIRQDCVTILDQGISTANAQQAIDMRKNQMQYDTFYTSIFTQHLEITDEWSGKPVKVTPTFFLASKIPLNDTAYSPAVNFVGPRRGVISGFNSVSWIPTEPEKDQLYRNQINYIERDNIATLFATELTSQTKNTPLTLIHAVRTLLRLRRSMVSVSRSYRSEFANSDVYGLLQTELNEIASSYVLAGGYEYITPVINTSDYDRQQRICRVDVDVAFTDIIERFAFNFIVNRV